MTALRVVLGWSVAVLATVVLGSIVQTQFNLAELAALGAPMDPGTRLGATWHDLLHFTPLYALLVAAAFAVAWPVAGLLARRVPRYRSALFALAGFTAVLAMILIMNAVLPITPIAATRGPIGTLLMSLAGAVAGWLHAVLSKKR
ncbi:MAG: hypothetical protein ACNS61_01900 [Candidatus Wenzhouxiangella sp. M2_3B_020]